MHIYSYFFSVNPFPTIFVYFFEFFFRFNSLSGMQIEKEKKVWIKEKIG